MKNCERKKHNNNVAQRGYGTHNHNSKVLPASNKENINKRAKYIPKYKKSLISICIQVQYWLLQVMDINRYKMDMIKQIIENTMEIWYREQGISMILT